MTNLLEKMGFMTPSPVGMEAVITALSSALSVDTFFGVVAKVIPFLGIMVPVALGIYFLRKLVKGAGKGKVRF